MKTILLAFDIEEFDLPKEFGIPLKKEEEFEISKEGFLSVLDLLKKHEIRSTFFTTADFAKEYPLLIKKSSYEHEIACHGYCHSDSYIENLSRIPLAKKELEDIIKKPIKGFRAPRFEIKEIHKLSDFGFSYDSSIHPTWIPGRYMNMFKKRKVHKIGNITEIPISVSSFFRLPVSWIFFRNLGINYSKIFTTLNMISSDYTMIYFHPWEFTDLSGYTIPRYIKRKSGDELLKSLEDYIKFCKRKNWRFQRVDDYLKKYRSV